MATAPLEISVVIPVYGSELVLPELVSRLEPVLLGLAGAGRFEVILVHDCSPDQAWRAITGLAESRPWLRALDLRLNAGQHNAVMAGLRHARGRIIVTMDDDLQHDPDDIPKLVSAVRAGADVCYASFRARQHQAWKVLGSRINDLVAQFLLKKPRGLYLSPFRAMVAGVRDEVVRYRGPNAYVDGLVLLATRRIASVEVEHHARYAGESGYSLHQSVSLWLKMATGFSIKPLRVASWLGMSFSAVGFVLAVVLVVDRLLGGSAPTGWASLIVSVLILGGIQLLAIGAIGEYVGRIFLTINGRPQYVVASRVNFEGEAESADPPVREPARAPAAP
jgi:polyisoprenyl-phosphate glycosyltransferase